MAGGPIVVIGNLKIGASSATATEVGGVVSSFRLQGTREIVPIPPVLTATVRDNRVGWSDWTLAISFYSNPDATSASFLTRLLLAAMVDTAASPPGSLYYEGTLKGGTVSTSNPKWSGRFLVAGVGYGGQVGEVSTDSQTYPLTAAPTEAFS